MLILGVGLEFDPDTSHGLECMTEHEKLRLGIQGCPPPRLPKPGGPDFQAAVLEVDLEETGPTGDASRRPIYGRERDSRPLIPPSQRSGDSLPHVVRRETPLGPRLERSFAVGLGERFEADKPAFKNRAPLTILN